MSTKLPASGEGQDLYRSTMRHPYRHLPDPKGIPFYKQGTQIIFDQPHIDQRDVTQATTYLETNPLPYGHFVGVGLNGEAPRQINQPDFLSINDDIYLQ